ncbi:MAG: hypothetical protein RR425_05065 [Erysipelotrichales bacterium]
MKNIKKFLKLSFALVLMITLVTGCGGDKKSASEVGTMYLDAITQKDKAIDNLKEYYDGTTDMGEFDIEKMKDQATAAMNIPNLSKAQKDKLVNSIVNVMKKAEYKAEDGEKEGEVTFKIKGVDITSAMLKTQTDLEKKIKAGKYSTEQQAMDAMVDAMVKNLDGASLSATEQTLKVEFEQKDGKWIPKEPEQFGNQTGAKLLGM